MIFRNKMLSVPPSKPNLKAFLDAHPGNTKNGGTIFQESNKESDFTEQVDKDFIISEAISMIRSRSIDDLLPIAMSLNINTNQEDIKVKHALVRYAKSKPQQFIDMFNNPVVMVKTIVMQGLDFQIISNKKGVIAKI